MSRTRQAGEAKRASAKSRSAVVAAVLVSSLLPSPGISAGGMAKLQTAAPSCADDSGDIYVDCGNGTVTDNRTGLVWLARANCLSSVSWHDAMKLVAGLSDLPETSVAVFWDCGLADGSSPGEWRLPSIAELETMFADGIAGACVPTVTDDEGTGCWSSDCHSSGACAFSGVLSTQYWSSTSKVSTLSDAWTVDVEGVAGSRALSKLGDLPVWPVRGGQ